MMPVLSVHKIEIKCEVKEQFLWRRPVSNV